MIASFPLDEIVFDTDSLYAYILDAKNLYTEEKFVRKIPEYLKKPRERTVMEKLSGKRSHIEETKDGERGPIEIEDEEGLAEHAYLVASSTYYMGTRISTLNAKLKQNTKPLTRDVNKLIRTTDHEAFGWLLRDHLDRDDKHQSKY